MYIRFAFENDPTICTSRSAIINKIVDEDIILAKKEAISVFTPIHGLQNLYSNRLKRHRGIIVKLSENKACLINPIKGSPENVIESIKEIGPVSFILAPNHYHNKGLEEHCDHFKSANLCSSKAAIPRLRKITGLEPTNTNKLAKALPENMSLLTPPGLKTGEVWLRIKQKKKLIWIVTDAFCGPDTPDEESETNNPDFPKLFPRVGVLDRDVYRDWLINQIKTDKPTSIVPCHGGLIQATNLTQQLMEIAEVRL